MLEAWDTFGHSDACGLQSEGSTFFILFISETKLSSSHIYDLRVSLGFDNAFGVGSHGIKGALLYFGNPNGRSMLKV